MRVMFVARALHDMAGGVERMIVTIMNAMIEKGHSVSLFTWDCDNAHSFYPLDARVEWIKLNDGDHEKRASWGKRWKRVGKIRSLVKLANPDLMICFQDGPYMAMRGYTLGLKVPIIVAERNAPTRFEYTSAKKMKNIIYFSFIFAKQILIQIETYKKFYPSFLHHKITVIPNPVFPAGENNRATPEKIQITNKYNIISVGRLSYQKNYPSLIMAFSILAAKYPKWNLIIIGEGERRNELENLIDKELKLSHRIKLVGTKKNLSKVYKKGNLFVLPSKWEGFPNALAEALAHGLPSVGFKECAGVSNLIQHEKNGILAIRMDNPNDLAMACDKIMGSPVLRKKMGNNAINSITIFKPSTIFDSWHQLILSHAKP